MTATITTRAPITRPLRSSTMAGGSYGIQPRRNGGLVTVWFCGRVAGHGHAVGDHCAHATRDEARDCRSAR